MLKLRNLKGRLQSGGGSGTLDLSRLRERSKARRESREENKDLRDSFPQTARAHDFASKFEEPSMDLDFALDKPAPPKSLFLPPIFSLGCSLVV